MEPRTEGSAITSSTSIDLSTPPPSEPKSLRRAKVNYAELNDSDYIEQEIVVASQTKHKYTPISADYPSVCEMSDGSLAELRCCICGANATRRNGIGFMLEVGVSMQRHYIASHKDFWNDIRWHLKPHEQKVDVAMGKSVHKILSDDEAAAIKGDTGAKYRIEPVFSKQALKECSVPKTLVDAAPGCTSSRNEDEDDDEDDDDSKPLITRRSVKMTDSIAGNQDDIINPTAANTANRGVSARKSTPGCGKQALAFARKAIE
ncbi:hypothetical protein TI39_contig305g00040 [Zymoseptoria brevis]|uniref:Uncharacterized protein n=1 Tax=Zymoseptoria brevis TaxID=1047168 RepID=A0A0F4GVH1_9PEZI|nr:hypothetical protein TI39_contig305g00040 [Zymoseptoria brevis]